MTRSLDFHSRTERFVKPHEMRGHKSFLSCFLLLATLVGVLSVSVGATCIDKDVEYTEWNGVCSYIEQQSNPAEECAIAIGFGMPADLCCVCSPQAPSLGELQTMLPYRCKVRAAAC